MNIRLTTLLFAWMPLAFLAVGCGSGDDELRTFSEADNVDNTDPPDVHEHATHGPNGGHLVELGGEDYHAEVVFDHDSRELTVYLLGSDAETAMPVSTETVTLNLQLDDGPASVELASAPLEGEYFRADGTTSRFTASGDAIPEAIHDEEDVHGSVVVMIDGQQYRGEITHDHDHGDEHDHGHDHDDDQDHEGHADGDEEEADAEE